MLGRLNLGVLVIGIVLGAVGAYLSDRSLTVGGAGFAVLALVLWLARQFGDRRGSRVDSDGTFFDGGGVAGSTGYVERGDSHHGHGHGDSGSGDGGGGSDGGGGGDGGGH